MPTTVLPQLDNKETTVQSSPVPTYGQSLRHSCQQAFDAAYQVYRHLDAKKPRDRSWTLEYCRSFAWFTRHADTGEVRVATKACHLRWCPVCARIKRNYITHAVAEWVSRQKYPKFLTFTLQHSDEPLEFQIDRLYKAFREIRRMKDFKAKIHGGVWFFQIKRSKNDGFWHPHLHCLCEGFYLYNRRLSRMWEQVTCGSTIVDIRPVHDPQAAANDVARYASSPGTLVGMSLADGCEMVNAVHGKRICGTWGSGRALSLRPAKQIDKAKWQSLGTWDHVLKLKDTDQNAKAIVNAWLDKKPLDKDISVIEPLITAFMSRHIATLWDEVDEVQKPERSPP